MGGQRNQPFVYTPHKRRGPISAGDNLWSMTLGFAELLILIQRKEHGWTLDRAGIRNLLLKLTCIILMVDIIKLQRLLFSEFSSPGPAAICLPSLIGGAFHTFSLSTSPSLHFSSGSYPIRLHLLVLSLHLEQFSSKT